MFLEPYLENLIIYGENVSLFYLACALISFLAVWFTWNIEPRASFVSKEGLTQTSNCEIDFFDENCEESLKNKAERKALIKSIEENLTVDDRVRETEMEKQQLKDILDLMRCDEQFNSMTMEELQEQLKLYRE